MERTKLKEARKAKGLREGKKITQQDVADAIGCSRDIVSLWELGQSDPQEYYRDALCVYFGITDPRDLDLVPRVRTLSLEEIIKMLEKYDRREVIAALQQLSVFAAIEDNQNRHGTSVISVEEFLSQCTAALSSCWHLLQHKGFVVAENVLSANMPRLAILCQEGQHLDNAASLAAQAKILQSVLSMHRLDYASRETCCLEAVRYGEMTRDHRIHAAALMYLAYTYTYCYPRDPREAVRLFNQALKLLDSEAYLLESDICMGLADAYAQCKEETKALKAIERSKIAMPPQPQQDPSFNYADCVLSDCYQWQGRMYIDLSAHFPDKGYAQNAYDSLLMSDSLGAPSARTTSETSIYLAEAARGIGDLDEYVKCLTKGVLIALEIGSEKRYAEAVAVLQKAPKAWCKEEQYQSLSELFVPRRA